jgi:predicted dehydrogenase
MPFSRREFVLSAPLAAAAQTKRSANDRLQVGVIGCGARSQELMEALMANANTAIVAIADAYKGRVQRTQENWGAGAKAHADYREMLGRADVDAVIIASPDHWHKQMCLDAIAAGKDVYCEKPLTYRSAEGNEIIAAAAQKSRIVQVGSQGVSGVLQQKARELIRAGKIGKVTMIRAAYNRNTAAGAWIYPIPPDASPQTVNWDQFQGPAAKKYGFSPERFFRWRCYQDYSGGIATDLFVHLCTTIHYLMGATAPAKVVGLGELYRWKESRDVPDTINGLLEYPEGFAVNLSSTFNNESMSEGSFQFLGTEGTLQLNFSSLRLLPESGVEDNRWIVESWPKAMEEAYFKNPKVRATEMPHTRRPRVKGAGESWTAEGTDANVAHFANWIESIRTRQAFWEDAQAGHRAAACAHMINQSAREERVVKWDFARNDVA